MPELGWPPCRRHGRGFRRATCGPLLRVAVKASWSVPQTAFRTFRQALLCSASRDRAHLAQAILAQDFVAQNPLCFCEW